MVYSKAMIIGITGTNGAGKGTVVDYLVRQKGFKHYSVRQFLLFEIEKRGLPPDRNSTRLVANELRKAHGPSYVIERLYAIAGQEHGPTVIESIRTVGEAEFLKSQGALLWAVNADRKVRYERILKRWSELDKVDFEKFCEYEDREMRSTEAWDMNVFKVMEMADATFTNDGTQDGLYQQVEAALKAAGV